MQGQTTDTVQVSSRAFEFIKTTLSDHRSFIGKVNINPLIKQSLIDDVTKIEDAIKMSTKKDGKNGHDLKHDSRPASS